MALSTTARRAALVVALATVPVALATTPATAAPPAPVVQAVAPAAVPVALAAQVALVHPAAEDVAEPVQRRVRSAQRTQTVEPTCAIGGIVWDDATQDGLKTTGETGVSGSEVVLRWDGSTVLTSVMTGVDGRYLFDGLQCGAYDVGFTLPTGYSWTNPALGDGTDDSQATDPGPSFIDGVTPKFTVGPGEATTRRTVAADAVQAAYLDSNVDAGLFATGSSAAVLPAAPAPAAPVPAAPAPAAAAPAPVQAPGSAPVPDAAAAAAGDLAYTGTATENLAWTGAALLAAGAAMVVGTSRRPRRVLVEG